MEILFSKNHRARRVQAADDLGILGWDSIFEERTGCGGADAGGVDEVFEPDWNPVQGAAIFAAKYFLFGAAGLIKRRVGQHGDEGV